MIREMIRKKPLCQSPGSFEHADTSPILPPSYASSDPVVQIGEEVKVVSLQNNNAVSRNAGF